MVCGEGNWGADCVVIEFLVWGGLCGGVGLGSEGVL